MGLVLMVHKVALLLALVFGILSCFKKFEKLKKAHVLAAVILVISILIYLFQVSFTNVRYVIYGLFLLLVFISPKIVKGKGKLFSHIVLALLAIVCLVVVHII